MGGISSTLGGGTASVPPGGEWVPAVGDISTPVTHKGLANPAGANNCFLNVTIQALWHLTSFRRALLAMEPHTHHTADAQCVTCALRSLYTFYEYTDDSVIPPDGVRAALADIYKGANRFSLGSMEDAAETLLAMCRCIHQEALEARKHADAALLLAEEAAVAEAVAARAGVPSGIATAAPEPASDRDAAATRAVATAGSPADAPPTPSSASPSTTTPSAVTDVLDVPCNPPCPAHAAFSYESFSWNKCLGCGTPTEPVPARDLSYLVYVSAVEEALRILEAQAASAASASATASGGGRSGAAASPAAMSGLRAGSVAAAAAAAMLTGAAVPSHLATGFMYDVIAGGAGGGGVGGSGASPSGAGGGVAAPGSLPHYRSLTAEEEGIRRGIGSITPAASSVHMAGSGAAGGSPGGTGTTWSLAALMSMVAALETSGNAKASAVPTGPSAAPAVGDGARAPSSTQPSAAADTSPSSSAATQRAAPETTLAKHAHPHPIPFTDATTGRTCSDSRHVPERFLLQPFPPVFTVSLVWPASTAPKHQIRDTMMMLEQSLDLRVLFKIEGGGAAGAIASPTAAGATSPSSSTVYRLRGLVCYYGKHYVCFMASEAQRKWLQFDDSYVPRVGDWGAVVQKVVDSRYQPVILFYEQQKPVVSPAVGAGFASPTTLAYSTPRAAAAAPTAVVLTDTPVDHRAGRSAAPVGPVSGADAASRAAGMHIGPSGMHIGPAGMPAPVGIGPSGVRTPVSTAPPDSTASAPRYLHATPPPLASLRSGPTAASHGVAVGDAAARIRFASPATHGSTYLSPYTTTYAADYGGYGARGTVVSAADATAGAVRPGAGSSATTPGAVGRADSASHTGVASAGPLSPPLLGIGTRSAAGATAGGRYSEELASILRADASTTGSAAYGRSAAGGATGVIGAGAVSASRPAPAVPAPSYSSPGSSATGLVGAGAASAGRPAPAVPAASYSSHTLSPPGRYRADAIILKFPREELARVVAATPAGTQPFSLLSTLGIDVAEIPSEGIGSFSLPSSVYVTDIRREGSTYRALHPGPWDPAVEPLAKLLPGCKLMSVASKSVSTLADADTALATCLRTELAKPLEHHYMSSYSTLPALPPPPVSVILAFTGP